jgi:hypothetical protein
VQITRVGSELTIAGSGRAFSTSSCWESYPGLSRISHSAPPASVFDSPGGQANWSSVCKTAASDPRRANVKTSVTATADRIVLAESGSYEFLLESSKCNATVDRQRVFTRSQTSLVSAPASVAAAPAASSARAATGGGTAAAGGLSASGSGAAVPPADPGGNATLGGQDSASVEQTTPITPPDCTTVGRLDRLRIEPSITWARPGTSLEVKVDARDPNGCAIAKPRLAWTFEPPGSLVFRGPKKLRISTAASEGTLKMVARQGSIVAEATIEVVSEARLQAFLAPTPPAPNAPETAPVVSAMPSEMKTVATAALVASDEGARRKWLFTAVALLVCGVFAGLGVVLLRQGRATRRARQGAHPRNEAEGVVKVCPNCGAEYGSGFQFCGRDGTVLVLRG